jgi:hypothetical protein
MGRTTHKVVKRLGQTVKRGSRRGANLTESPSQNTIKMKQRLYPDLSVDLTPRRGPKRNPHSADSVVTASMEGEQWRLHYSHLRVNGRRLGNEKVACSGANGLPKIVWGGDKGDIKLVDKSVYSGGHPVQFKWAYELQKAGEPVFVDMFLPPFLRKEKNGKYLYSTVSYFANEHLYEGYFKVDLNQKTKYLMQVWSLMQVLTERNFWYQPSEWHLKNVMLFRRNPEDPLVVRLVDPDTLDSFPQENYYPRTLASLYFGCFKHFIFLLYESRCLALSALNNGSREEYKTRIMDFMRGWSSKDEINQCELFETLREIENMLSKDEKPLDSSEYKACFELAEHLVEEQSTPYFQMSHKNASGLASEVETIVRLLRSAPASAENLLRGTHYFHRTLYFKNFQRLIADDALRLAMQPLFKCFSDEMRKAFFDKERWGSEVVANLLEYLFCDKPLPEECSILQEAFDSSGQHRAIDLDWMERAEKLSQEALKRTVYVFIQRKTKIKCQRQVFVLGSGENTKSSGNFSIFLSWVIAKNNPDFLRRILEVVKPYFPQNELNYLLLLLLPSSNFALLDAAREAGLEEAFVSACKQGFLFVNPDDYASAFNAYHFRHDAVVDQLIEYLNRQTRQNNLSKVKKVFSLVDEMLFSEESSWISVEGARITLMDFLNTCIFGRVGFLETNMGLLFDEDIQKMLINLYNKCELDSLPFSFLEKDQGILYAAVLRSIFKLAGDPSYTGGYDASAVSVLDQYEYNLSSGADGLLPWVESFVAERSDCCEKDILSIYQDAIDIIIGPIFGDKHFQAKLDFRLLQTLSYSFRINAYPFDFSSVSKVDLSEDHGALKLFSLTIFCSKHASVDLKKAYLTWVGETYGEQTSEQALSFLPRAFVGLSSELESVRSGFSGALASQPDLPAHAAAFQA